MPPAGFGHVTKGRVSINMTKPRVLIKVVLRHYGFKFSELTCYISCVLMCSLQADQRDAGKRERERGQSYEGLYSGGGESG